jgi:putative two-component system response regulator
MGRDAITRAEQELGHEVPFLRIAKAISLSHHEKWDGTGYPQGLAGEAIPLPARLMALADVYDALTTRRVYKPAFSHEVSCRIVCEGRGTHFDPDVLDAFVAVQDDFRDIAARFAEPEND